MPMPGPTSMKNSPLAGAAGSLGLGDQLSQQLSDQLDEQKKLKKMNPNQPGLTPAVQSLLGTQTGLM